MGGLKIDQALRTTKLQTVIMPVAVFGLSLALYLFTLAPTVLWGEDAKFQRMAYLWILEYNEWGHPLWVTIAHGFTLLPLGDAAFRVNLSAALFSATAILLLYLIVKEITKSSVAAIIASICLAFSHTFWLFAVRGKGIYSLNSVLLFAIIYLLIRRINSNTVSTLAWQAVLAAGLYGLALGNHLIFAALAPGLAVLFARVLIRRPFKPLGILLSVLAFLHCLAPYVLLTVQSGESPRMTGTALGFVDSLISIENPDKSMRDFLLYFTYQFPGPGIILGFAGAIATLKTRKMLTLSLALMFFLVSLSNLDFDVPDKFQYFLPAYLVFSIYIGVGTQALLRVLKTRASQRAAVTCVLMVGVMCAFLPVGVYELAPNLATRLRITPAEGRDLPGRDLLSFHLIPSKRGYMGAREFGEQTFRLMPQNSVIVADYTPAQTLKYLQTVEGQRPDIEIAELYETDQLPYLLANQNRPAFLADIQKYYDIEGIGKAFKITSVGPVYRLVARSAATDK